MPFFRRRGGGRNKPNPKADLVMGVLFLVGAVTILIWQLSWIKEAFGGPREIEESEIAAVTDKYDLPKDYVVFTPTVIEKVADKKKSADTPDVKYFVVKLQDEYMLVQIPRGQDEKRLAGYIKPDGSRETRSTNKGLDAARSILGKTPLKQYYMIVDPDQKPEAYTLLGILLACVLFGSFLAYRGWKSTHPPKPEAPSIEELPPPTV